MTEKKKKTPGPAAFWIAYLTGTFLWMVGAHCLEGVGKGSVGLSWSKLRKHLFALCLWSLSLTLLFHLFRDYSQWLMDSDNSQKLTALLVKSVLFLYVKVFWPQVFPMVLPGVRYASCPQCYQKRVFRFLPLSVRLGNGVTFLCRHCSCLVDGWGEQVLYPSESGSGTVWEGLWRTFPWAFAVIVAGIAAGEWSWRLF